jgi:hypothetical protein
MAGNKKTSRGASVQPGKTGKERRDKASRIALPNSPMDRILCERAAMWNVKPEEGAQCSQTTAGPHGGGKRTKNRRDRHSRNLQVRRGEYD